MILIFSDLNKAQIYEMPYRDSPHHEHDTHMSFHYLKLFKPNEHTEDYHIREPNGENFLFHVKEKEYVCLGDKAINEIVLKQMKK